QAEDGIRDRNVTGVQTCALPISDRPAPDLSGIGRSVPRSPRRRCRALTTEPRTGICARDAPGPSVGRSPGLGTARARRIRPVALRLTALPRPATSFAHAGALPPPAPALPRTPFPELLSGPVDGSWTTRSPSSSPPPKGTGTRTCVPEVNRTQRED